MIKTSIISSNPPRAEAEPDSRLTRCRNIANEEGIRSRGAGSNCLKTRLEVSDIAWQGDSAGPMIDLANHPRRMLCLVLVVFGCHWIIIGDLWGNGASGKNHMSQ